MLPKKGKRGKLRTVKHSINGTLLFSVCSSRVGIARRNSNCSRKFLVTGVAVSRARKLSSARALPRYCSIYARATPGLLERTISQGRWVMHVPLRNGISCKGNAPHPLDSLVPAGNIHSRNGHLNMRRSWRSPRGGALLTLLRLLAYRPASGGPSLINAFKRVPLQWPFKGQ